MFNVTKQTESGPTHKHFAGSETEVGIVLVPLLLVRARGLQQGHRLEHFDVWAQKTRYYGQNL